MVIAVPDADEADYNEFVNMLCRDLARPNTDAGLLRGEVPQGLFAGWYAQAKVNSDMCLDACSRRLTLLTLTVRGLLENAGYRLSPREDASAGLKSYASWHHLVGSTTDWPSAPKLDLPGDLSLVGVMQRIKQGLSDDEILQPLNDSLPHRKVVPSIIPGRAPCQ